MFGNLLSNLTGFGGAQQASSFGSGGAPSPSFDAGLIGNSGGFVGSSFNAVLNSVNSNAEQGISPFGNGANSSSNLSPGQIAAQMQIGGASSILPVLGNKFLPKILFPIAGLWSIVGGIKAMIGLRNEAAAGTTKFDPSQLNYYKTSSQLESVYANPVFRATQQQREFYGDSRGDAGFSGGF